MAPARTETMRLGTGEPAPQSEGRGSHKTCRHSNAEGLGAQVGESAADPADRLPALLLYSFPVAKKAHSLKMLILSRPQKQTPLSSTEL